MYHPGLSKFPAQFFFPGSDIIKLGITLGGQKLGPGRFLTHISICDMIHFILIMMSLPGPPACAGIFDNPEWYVKQNHVKVYILSDFTTSYFPLIVLGYPLDFKRSYGPLPDTLCPGACFFPPLGSRGQFGLMKSTADKDWLLPVPTYGSTWVVLWLLFFRSAPSTFPNKQCTIQGLFRGVPSR